MERPKWTWSLCFTELKSRWVVRSIDLIQKSVLHYSFEPSYLTDFFEEVTTFWIPKWLRKQSLRMIIEIPDFKQHVPARWSRLSCSIVVQIGIYFQPFVLVARVISETWVVLPKITFLLGVFVKVQHVPRKLVGRESGFAVSNESLIPP